MAALTLATAVGKAADVAGRETSEVTVEGRITPYNSSLSSGISVELLPQTGTGRHQTYVDASGVFRFNGLAAGEYSLTVKSAAGAVLYQETVMVRDEFTRLNVELTGVRLQPPANSQGTVSIADLKHKVPGKAAKEFRKSDELIGKGRIEDAIGHLQNAVSADPAFARAYNNLAACEASLKHFDKAAEYGRKAVQLDPGLPEAQINLSHILLALHEYSGAEAAARATLRLARDSGKAHWFLGLALLGQKRLDEALQNFTRAVDSVPAARLYAADLLARSGNTGDAANQLRAYLRSADAENRAEVERWLARLGK